MALINKDAKITDFMNLVVAPALNSVEFHKENVDTDGFSSDLNLHTPIDTVLASPASARGNSVVPTSFPVLPTIGSLLSATDLASLFMTYAWHLTSIRRARLTRLNTNDGVATNELISDGITTLSSAYAMPIVNFNDAVQAAPNPLAALQPSNVATEAALDALINRLASVCANHRPNLVNLSICHGSCHSSCHGSCHGSRGRR
ncbi:MAG: hypothetical protein ACLGG7_12105 [Bacteriovoracia bacterium]